LATALTCSIWNVKLQAIDASVALPYWRFDQPAPNIFTLDFFGVSDPIGTVKFSATNPLQFWKTDGVQGINRRPFFNTGTAPPGLRTETQTLALGTQYPAFRTLEGNPHGSAHTSFGGSISSIGTAAKDPLFFLLHCNVDRLWGSGNARTAASIRRRRPRSTTAGKPIGHNCRTRCGLGMESPAAHVLRRLPAAPWPRHHASARQACSRECETPWIIKARSAPLHVWDSTTMSEIRLTCLARGDSNHGHETENRKAIEGGDEDKGRGKEVGPQPHCRSRQVRNGP